MSQGTTGVSPVVLLHCRGIEREAQMGLEWGPAHRRLWTHVPEHIREAEAKFTQLLPPRMLL